MANRDYFGSGFAGSTVRHSELVSESHCRDCYPDLRNSFAQQTVKDLSPLTSHFSRKRTAFTLAEVLITLGIIGVVAALTMPVLMAHHRRSVVETSLKKFYSTINQAILLSANDNEAPASWTFPENDTSDDIKIFYNQYLSKYINAANTDVTTVKKSNGNSDLFTIYFADGAAAALSWKAHDWYYCIKSKDLANFADRHGTGCFIFGLYPARANDGSYSSQSFRDKGLEPYVKGNMTDEDGNTITDDDGKPVNVTEADLYSQECYAKKIQLNGWKIPDDYPLKF